MVNATNLVTYRSFSMRRFAVLSLVAITFFSGGAAAADWKPAEGPLMTRWAKDVSPTNVHPEYPRPQMVREKWVNLNGLWDYAVVPQKPVAQARDSAANRVSISDEWDGQILVPFP